MPATRLVTFGLALISGAAAAHAQTVVTRQISEEPVETTIVQGPNGTVITRRPLDATYSRRVVSPGYVSPGYVSPGYVAGGYVAPRFVAPTYVAPTYVAPAYVAPGYGTVQARAMNAPAVVIEEADDDDGEVIESVRVRRPPAPIAAPSRVVARRGAVPVMARAVESEPKPVARVRTVSAPLALRPAQRQIVYRTIVRERVYAQPATVGYVPGYAAIAPAYAVGYAIPQTIVLTAVPQALAAQVPMTGGYRYMVLDNRVLLVDPATNVIVADLRQ